VKKMLFLTTRPPFPPIGGEKIRPYNFIKYLRRDYAIKVLSFAENDKESKEARENTFDDVELEMISLPRIKSYFQTALGLFTDKPLELGYYTSSLMQKAVSRELNSAKYDLVFCHLLRMAHFVEDHKIKKVLDLCDALTLRYALSSSYRKNIFKVIEGIESRRLSIYEPAVIKKFDLALISSSRDKDFLENNLSAKGLQVVENGIDLKKNDYPKIAKDLKKIIFFGNLRTFHNVDAVNFFSREIWPLIKSKVSDARLVIAGANIPSAIMGLKKEGEIEVYSDVEDLDALISSCSVSVAPMRIAVGIQNKVIKSMSLGIPVVVTGVGLGGIAAEDGKSIMIADSRQDFAQKVIMLLSASDLRDNIVSNAFKLLEDKYTWPKVFEGLRAKIDSILT
jgi:glycosyltransferase involved in cell wall biosynthesis